MLFALRHLTDSQGDDTYKLNQNKIMKAIALKMMNEKPDGFYLDEFVYALK